MKKFIYLPQEMMILNGHFNAAIDISIIKAIEPPEFIEKGQGFYLIDFYVGEDVYAWHIKEKMKAWEIYMTILVTYGTEM